MSQNLYSNARFPFIFPVSWEMKTIKISFTFLFKMANKCKKWFWPKYINHRDGYSSFQRISMYWHPYFKKWPGLPRRLKTHQFLNFICTWYKFAVIIWVFYYFQIQKRKLSVEAIPGNTVGIQQPKFVLSYPMCCPNLNLFSGTHFNFFFASMSRQMTTSKRVIIGKLDHLVFF